MNKVGQLPPTFFAPTVNSKCKIRERKSNRSQPEVVKWLSIALTITVPNVAQDFFPLDKRWGIMGRSTSDGLTQEMVRLVGMMPYTHASRTLSRLAQVEIPATTLWEHTQREGERLETAQRTRETRTGVERTRWQDGQYDARLYRTISMDGGMVHIRGEGWKEMKVGLISGVRHQWDQDQHKIKLIDMDFTAIIGTVDQFKDAMWELAVRHDVLYAGRTAVTADGAHWIWRLAYDLFPVSTQIVDWYHARQHLWQAATSLHHDIISQMNWYEKMSKVLFAGEIWKIILTLQQAQCDDEITYFVTHQRRMQYTAFRADGFPIGSGGVESGIKQFKQRLCGAGMRWSRTGAERMVVIRNAVMTDTLDVFWQAAA